MTLKMAGLDDIPVLAMHHRWMFEEIWEKKKANLSGSQAEALEKAYAEKLSRQLKEGACVAWILSEYGRATASGAITLVSLVPVPDDLNDQAAYLHSMYTAKDYRGKGYARRIVQAAIDFCRRSGIRRIWLNASEAGRPVYAALDFQAAPEAMRLFLPKQ